MDPPLHLQSFRIAPQCFSSASANNHNPIHALPTRFDPKTGRHFILWRDIQALFDHAKCVMANGVMVYFMEGDNFERLEPLRIAHHPDTILEVVVTLIDIVSSSGSAAATTELGTPGTTIVDLETEVARLHIQDVPVSSREEPTSSTTTSSFQKATRTKERRPEASMSLTAQKSVQVFQGLRTSCIQAIMNGQVNQAEGIKAEMSRYFQEVKVETDKLNSAMKENATLQVRLLEMNETMVEMQKMTLDRLANIQGQIQAVLTQSYELHEYPVPRLFIILPQVARRRDALLKPFSQQFRLYFLCECGTHTTREGSKEIDKVHLADHPGYDIERPTEFFKQFGPYVLAVMRAVQLGARVASIVVPHLANSSLAQELMNVESYLESLQKGVEFYTKERIGAMVDTTVTYLEDLNQRHEERGVDGVESQTTTNQSVLNDAEAIEGVELKQLENFLSIADKERTLGNLYRSVTKEGHVKWVCRTHFRQNYRDQAYKRLLEVVDENSGSYDEQRGGIIVELRTKTLAKAFYSVLAQTPDLQELDITFMWDASLADIRTFTDAVLKSTLVSLCIRGDALSGPVSDVFNNGRRYDPILQLMAKGQIQMMRLRRFHDFFDHVSILSTIDALPTLRALDMCELRSKSEMLTDLVKKCTGLQRLAVEFSQDDQATALLNVSPQLLELRILYSLHWGTSHYAANLSNIIAELKAPNAKISSRPRLNLQSLIVLGTDAYQPNERLRDYSKAVSINFSKDGIIGISSTNWDLDVLRSFILRHGWALRNLDLANLQSSKADEGKRKVSHDLPSLANFANSKAGEGKLRTLDYVTWSRSIDTNRGASALEFLRLHESFLSREDRPALLSVIAKSPKLERLEIVIDQYTPGTVVLDHTNDYWNDAISWHFEHLASTITKLDLRGNNCIVTVIDYASRNMVTLHNLTELRWATPSDNHRPPEFTRKKWRFLFAPLNFSILRVLGFDMEIMEDFWFALLDSLPRNGLASNGMPIPLAVVEFGRTQWDEKGEDLRLKRQQLSESAPFARLKCSPNSVWQD